MDLLYKKNNSVIALTPIDIKNGYAVGLTELTDIEKKHYLNPAKTTDEIQLEAQQLRDELTESNIELGETGAIYQIDARSRDNISQANIKAGGSGDLTRQWRLSDNTWRETSLDELNSLVLSYINRKELIWNAFAEWDSGDKSEPFELELS